MNNQPPARGPNRIKLNRVVSKVAAVFCGYDIFISYRHLDAHGYANELEKALEAKGLLVFRDESDEDVGTPLSVFIKRACAARTFVILVTPNVFKSSNVLDELSAYIKHRISKWHRKPFSRVISVNVDQALSTAPPESEWNRLADYVYVAETATAVAKAAPSTLVVDRLVRSSSFLRSWQLFSMATFAVATAILISIVSALIYLHSVLDRLSSTKVELVDTQNSLQTAQGKTKDLQDEATRLDAERYMLTVRNAAADQLTQDPLIAYRLAEKAFALKPDAINRKLLLQTLSNINLSYQLRKTGFSVEAMAEPFILLKSDNVEEFSVFNMRTREIQGANVGGARGWIVPLGKRWRTLTLDWVGDGADATLTYGLFDHAGNQIGERVESGRLKQVRFLNEQKVMISLRNETKMLVWDLTEDQRQLVELESTDVLGGGYFRGIYGALDTRADGCSAVHDRDGLVLLDNDGNIKPDSYTQVSFDPSSFFSAARWSSDDQFLALNYFDRQRLGVWNPITASFHWLDPSGWVVDSYTWSLSGHLLAFSGHTENIVDATVEVVDAATPVDSRKILLSSGVPIRSLAFLPGDAKLAIADRDGGILMLEVANGQLIGRGKHPDVRALYGSKYGVYSSSKDDFRVWDGLPTPAKYWSFVSSGDRVYAALGTADSRWRWLAVPYREHAKDDAKDETNRIELRDVRTGESKDIPAPEGVPMNIGFSLDSKWLVFQTTDRLWIYDTDEWNATRFSLIEGDRQFFDLRFDGEMVYAQVLGANDVNKSSGTLDYIFKFGNQGPVLDKRVSSTGDEAHKDSDEELGDKIDGWKLDSMHRYRSAGLRAVVPAGWAYYVRCRDQALGARDCDVQFIPTDIDRLTSLYDSILWKPTKQELETWVEHRAEIGEEAENK